MIIASSLVRILQQADQVVPEFLLLTGTSSAVDNFRSGKFSARDVRTVRNREHAQPAPQEIEEKW